MGIGHDFLDKLSQLPTRMDFINVVKSLIMDFLLLILR